MRIPRGSVHRTLLLAITFGVSVSPALGQCGAGWVTGIGNPGVTQQWAGYQFVGALLQLPDEDILVCGQFHMVDQTPVHNLARYHPADSTWSSLGSGLTSTRFSDAMSLGLVQLPNGDIVTIGLFDTADGVDVGGGIARYRPSTDSWSPVLPGYANAVNRIVLLSNGDGVIDYLDVEQPDSPQTIARVDFSTGVVTPVASAPIANGSWYGPIGVLPDDEVLVGGLFDHAGDIAANGIAAYSFSTGAWRSFGSGLTTGGVAMNACANAAILLPGGDLIVGGLFTEAGGSPANNIARCNPATGVWSPLGAGVNDQVVTLTLAPDQTIIAGGVFRTAGGVDAPIIARYSLLTGAWSALGDGMDGGAIYAAALLQHNSIALGGFFWQAGGRDAGSLAQFSLDSSSDFDHDGDSGTDADIEAFFACLAGNCCSTCGSADFNGDGDSGTDSDMEAFFRVLAGGAC